MQEKSLYAKFKTVISHLYQSITSEDDLRISMIKRRMDFVRNEIIILGEELGKLEKDLVFADINKALDNLPDKNPNEFDEFRG